MKTAPIVGIICTILLAHTQINASYADDFITIRNFILSRSDPRDPYNLYIVSMRCALVYKILDEISTKNNENNLSYKFKQRMDQFIDKMTKFGTVAGITNDRSKTDIKLYYGIYEERMLKNYALRGNYLDEPTYAEDLNFCKLAR